MGDQVLDVQLLIDTDHLPYVFLLAGKKVLAEVYVADELNIDTVLEDSAKVGRCEPTNGAIDNVNVVQGYDVGSYLYLWSYLMIIVLWGYFQDAANQWVIPHDSELSLHFVGNNDGGDYAYNAVTKTEFGVAGFAFVDDVAHLYFVYKK